MKPRSITHWGENCFRWLCLLATVLPLTLLVVLLADVLISGSGRLSWDFLASFPSRDPTKAGILPGLVGSFYLIGISAALALPLGVATAIYLEEFGNSSRIARLVELNISNLAGVPSVIYGLLGLEIFVRVFGLGHSLIAGSATMAILVLPIVITASREALRNVPKHYRQACYGLGSTKWQTVWQVVLPLAYPGILTGSILAVSRAIGETAPLVVVGAATYMAFLPDDVFGDYTVLPMQIFNWVSRPQKGFADNAAAAIVVLLGVLMLMNSVAIILRNRLQNRSVG